MATSHSLQERIGLNGQAREYLTAQKGLLTEQGVEARSRFLRLPWRGLRMHLLEAGEGPPLVFVIGGGGFSAMWAPLMARMGDYKLYALDRPGFGLTDPVEHRTETLRATAVGFLEAALDALGLGRATLVANSLGSQWTFWLALDRPERVARMIHLGCPGALLDTGAPMPLPLLGAPVVGRLLTLLMRPSLRQAQMVFDSMNEAEALEENPALGPALVATERLPAYDDAWRSIIGAVLSPLGSARDGMSLTAGQLREIQQPVQLIWGQEDPFGPVEAGRRAAELLPDARFAVVPGGHLPWLDVPEQVAAHINDFLDETDSA